MTELNLSGTGLESLPEDIVMRLPNLQKLHLDNCEKLTSLPILLGSLNALEHVGIKGCTALLHPPKSLRSDPAQTASFLRGLHDNSELWRRLKV